MFSAKDYALKVFKQMEADDLKALEVAQVIIILHSALGETLKELNEKLHKK